MEALVSAAEISSLAEAKDVAKLEKLLKSNDAAIRYWAAAGFFKLAKKEFD